MATATTYDTGLPVRRSHPTAGGHTRGLGRPSLRINSGEELSPQTQTPSAEISQAHLL